MARPRGAACGSASAILGMPVLAEKRTVTGTSCLKCNALLTLAASALGTNLPSRTTPLAWADRCVVCLPNAALSASTNDSGVVAIAGSFRVFIAVANLRASVGELSRSDRGPAREYPCSKDRSLREAREAGLKPHRDRAVRCAP